MSWSDPCGHCGQPLGVCGGQHSRRETDAPVPSIAPEGDYDIINAGEDSNALARYQMQQAQRRFARRVEQALETGDQSALDRRIDRFIDEVSR